MTSWRADSLGSREVSVGFAVPVHLVSLISITVDSRTSQSDPRYLAVTGTLTCSAAGPKSDGYPLDRDRATNRVAQRWKANKRNK